MSDIKIILQKTCKELYGVKNIKLDNAENKLLEKFSELLLEEAQAEITRLNYLVASQKETMEIMQDIIDTEQLKGVE